MTLTDEEIKKRWTLANQLHEHGGLYNDVIISFARIVIAAHDAKLREQGPAAFVLYAVGVLPCFTPVINGRYELKGDGWKPLYAAPTDTPSNRIAIDKLQDFILARPDKEGRGE